MRASLGYWSLITSVRTRAVGVPSSAGDASTEAHTEVIASADEKVVTAVRDGGRIKGSDAEIRNRFFHVRLEMFQTKPEALEAAGLSE